MFTVYNIILYLHIFSVILVIGPIFILFPLLNKLKYQVENQESELELIRFVLRLSEYAGRVLIIMGILLIWLGGWKWLESWIVMAVLLLICAIIFMERIFSPAIRKIESEEEESRIILINKLKQYVIYYISILLIAMWFMIQKPVLW
ncbi:DUF2269 family protein [Chengkuizengella sp. SCS-71B]|uniref:DUF2269 family protein n=1 Tax=Chengkuizengella sp. SCS-71B TaxID=3115290 RepID=UPI0032C22E87